MPAPHPGGDRNPLDDRDPNRRRLPTALPQLHESPRDQVRPVHLPTEVACALKPAPSDVGAATKRPVPPQLRRQAGPDVRVTLALKAPGEGGGQVVLFDIQEPRRFGRGAFKELATCLDAIVTGAALDKLVFEKERLWELSSGNLGESLRTGCRRFSVAMT